MKCEYCGAALPENAAECPACGAVLTVKNGPEKKDAAKTSAAGIICKQCGKVNFPDSRICVNCGKHLINVFRCTKCGKFFMEQVSFCDICGGTAVLTEPSPYIYRKYVLFSFLLGEFGAHFFYSGRMIPARIMLITSLCLTFSLAYVLFARGRYFGVHYTDVTGFSVLGLVIIYLVNIFLACFIKTDGDGKRMI